MNGYAVPTTPGQSGAGRFVSRQSCDRRAAPDLGTLVALIPERVRDPGRRLLVTSQALARRGRIAGGVAHATLSTQHPALLDLAFVLPRAAPHPPAPGRSSAAACAAA